MDQVQKFLTKYYRGVGTPLAKRAEMLVGQGLWAELQQLSLDHPSTYANAQAYKDAALVIEITRKLLLPGDRQKRIDNAVATFWQAERQCATTNARLRRFLNRGPFEVSDMAIDDFIKSWSRNVKRVLGNASWDLYPCFSHGSTLSDSRKLITIPDKMSSEPTAYTGFHPDLALLYKFTPMSKTPVRKRGNRFFTVPKDSFKDRGCCVEASLHIPLQLAVGKRLKAQMKKVWQVDLLHLQREHRDLAYAASRGDRLLATIDLSNASDTISSVLVRLLVGESWWQLLNSLRAQWTEIDGKWVRLEKFSSMGNGFTFELETIIFRTLCMTLGSQNVSVYGDDIIVEQALAPAVINALRFFGFEPNKKKTFCEGPFRESCGGDFFEGVDVRVHYLKEVPDEPQKWLALANGIYRLRDHRLRAAHRYCIDQLPADWRNYGPVHLGDTVIHDDNAEPKYRAYRTYEYDSVAGKKRWISHHQLPHWRIMRPVSRVYKLYQHWSPDIALAAAAMGVHQDVSTRDDIVGYKVSWVPAWGVADPKQTSWE